MKTVTMKSTVLGLVALVTFGTGISHVSAAIGQWTATGSMSIERSDHTATLLPNGTVLVTGGTNGQTSFPKPAALYNPTTGLWAMTGSMASRRASHTATLLQNGKVLVVGGTYDYSSGSTLLTAYVSGTELYDPDTGTWSSTDALDTARANHTATLLPDGKVLVVGGNNASGLLASAEIYDPSTGLWSTPDPWSTGVGVNYHTATMLQNGKVLLVGGVAGTYSSAAKLFDPTTRKWTTTGTMSTTRAHHTATLLANGKVLVTGGYGDSGRLATSQLYNPSTGTWSNTGSMANTREFHTATLLSNGKVLVAGGIYNNNASELYDPLAGTWAATGSMNVFRPFLASVSLPNGSVLAVGGRDRNVVNPVYSATAEVYEYASVILTLTAVNGQITGNSSPYSPNTTDTLTATADPGYLFAGWSGDASGTNNPLNILLDVSKTIEAVFTPDTRDDDLDGLTNYQEIVTYGTNPALPDTDGDNAKDSEDAFPLNPGEWLDTDHDGTGDNADTDDDGDGYSDADEINIHHTNPKRADSDGDGLPDPAEIQNHHTDPNLADTDSDGLSDGAEINTQGTLPLNPDTDGDGFLDGYEVQTGKSPLDTLDKPALVAEAVTAIEFTFPSALGRTYRIESSTDLTIWTTVESGVPGNGAVIQRFYSIRNIPKRYFRVEEDTP